MNSYSVNRFIASIPRRTIAKQAGCGPRALLRNRRNSGTNGPGRCFSTAESEQIPVIHPPTALQPPDVFSLDQRRSVSTSELDRYRDTRERIVILGSGWGGYSLSRSLDHKKYQVVLVGTITSN